MAIYPPDRPRPRQSPPRYAAATRPNPEGSESGTTGLDIATQPSHVPEAGYCSRVGVPAEVVQRLVVIEQATDITAQ